MKLLQSYDQSDNQDIHGMLTKELNDIVLVDSSKMLGRDFTLAKNSNPLQDVNQANAMTGLNTVQTQTILEKSKLLAQLDNMHELNKEILQCGNMAQCFYKTKNQLILHQNMDSSANNYKLMKVQCKRMIQIINYNISKHIFELKEEKNEILKGNSLLNKL